ncbi:MAG: N-acetylmuramoyl-L-alanine amidase [Acidimicrobiia bacterium]|nr:N-acetylmuramoyl-L-alanine amidase [Acidimicrobiia bacterium]
MKRPLLAAIIALATACAGTFAGAGAVSGGNAGPPTRQLPTMSVVATSVATSAATAATKAATAEERPVLGWMTTTGVPVSILSTDGVVRWVLTPCGREAPVVQGAPIYQTRVVIDPGHGGPRDTGAAGPGGLVEKDLNLSVARSVVFLLEMRGISAILTRTGDYPARLFVRSELADSLDAEVLVSIHHNSPPGLPSSHPGTDAFVQHGSDESARLGGLLWKRVTDAFSIVDVRWTAAVDSGVMTVRNTRGLDAYGMLRHPETPSVLLELGYISNPSEAQFFSKDIYPFYAAWAIVDAIVSYLDTDEPGVELQAGRVFNPQPGISSDACVDPDLG